MVVHCLCVTLGGAREAVIRAQFAELSDYVSVTFSPGVRADRLGPGAEELREEIGDVLRSLGWLEEDGRRLQELVRQLRCRAPAKVLVFAERRVVVRLLSEALDRIWAIGDVKEAAVAQGISLSQLVRLLSQEPAALQWANALRASKGQGPLRASR